MKLELLVLEDRAPVHQLLLMLEDSVHDHLLALCKLLQRVHLAHQDGIVLDELSRLLSIRSGKAIRPVPSRCWSGLGSKR